MMSKHPNDAGVVRAEAKRGGAWVHDKYAVSFFALPPRRDGVDQTRSGWMFGTGVEYAFYRHTAPPPLPRFRDLAAVGRAPEEAAGRGRQREQRNIAPFRRSRRRAAKSPGA